MDDETLQLEALVETLGLKGFGSKGYTSARKALDELRRGEYDLLLTDLMMPEMSGIELIAAAQRIDPDLGAIVMTGNGAIDTAVQAMQAGALDYILKPFRLDTMLPVIVRALDLRQLRRENARLLEKERRHAAELADAYRDLESFSYSVSHDLRAPLLFVKDFAQRLEDDFGDRLGEEGRRIARIIRDGGRSMDEMVVGLLAFARTSRQSLELRPLDMEPSVRACVAEARTLHPTPDGARAPQVDIGELPSAMADPVMIRHVWSNLVANALKYSSRVEQPRVSISGRIEGAETVYCVSDNGIGFDMRYAGKLFGVFRRLHGAREYPGAGVGLAIAHRVVQRHGGRIWAESTPGEGSRFSFTLQAVPNDPD